MRTYIGDQEAVSASEFIELALGTPPELWLGVPGETEEERAARQDAARDILADDPQLVDAVSRLAAEAIAVHAPALLNVVPLTRPARRRSRACGPEVAA
ncbi:hypothetical protein HUT19_21175 [Streptomyces sp. NA02950]|uniref:hypothetical protein n=1 Tax=Streptomyces sp. NA02950 TaxID=2742137 RepID=UPI001591E163|nr:hypothetical protein [Streptomyces sp. NA02950]QKV93958.1 hypothetical protein HUT19_21175 [Streptomyces sp. NA02950]